MSWWGVNVEVVVKVVIVFVVEALVESMGDLPCMSISASSSIMVGEAF